MKILILFLVFWVGFYLGKLDSKYGYEAGLKVGKATREFLSFSKGGQYHD